MQGWRQAVPSVACGPTSRAAGMHRMIRFGISRIPPEGVEDGAWLDGLLAGGHDAVELPFVQGFPWKERRCAAFGAAAAERGATVLLVALNGPMPEAYVPLAAYPSLASSGLKAHARRLKAKGRFSSLPMEIMKLQSRSETIDVPSLPVVLLPGADSWRPWLGDAGASPVTIRLNLHYRRRRWPTQNVLGYLVGADPILRREIRSEERRLGKECRSRWSA